MEIRFYKDEESGNVGTMFQGKHKGLEVTIKCYTMIGFSREQVDIILNVMSKELECVEEYNKNMISTGYMIAKGIVESLFPTVRASRVDGGEDGESWTIEISHDIHEFGD